MILYYALFTLAYLVSLLPLWLLYRLSDLLFYVLYHGVKYRRPLVRKNLSESFPEKDEGEIRQIEREFYAWFCDYIVETVKLMSIGRKNIMRRMRLENVEEINRVLAAGRNISLYLGHYCNWEWVTSIPLHTGDTAICGQIYHVLENKAFDRLLVRLRGRLGARNIPMAETLRHFVRMRQEGKPIIIGYIADQVPFWNNIHYWTDFLNHDTAMLTGTERITAKTHSDSYYLDIRRERRGCYAARFVKMADRDDKLPEYELTERYARLLEASIRRQPPYWLWSHNRWKRTRADWERIIDPETKKMRLEKE